MFCDMPENSRSAVTEAVDQRPSIQLKMKALSGVSLSGIIQKTSVFFGSTTADIFGKFPRMADADHVRSTFSAPRSEEHTSELQSLMRISYAVFCLKKKKQIQQHTHNTRKTHKTSQNQA